MKRYLPATLVTAGLLVGVLSLLLALDVSRSATTVEGDDARFLAQPRIAGYWEDRGFLPFDAGRRLLGAGDDIARRDAVQRFWLARPRDTSIPGPERLAERAQAQAALAEAEAGGGPGTSQTANLLGVLALLTPPDQAERSQVVRAAGAAFRRAIVLDPANDDAKFNLESVLRLVADERSRGQGGGGSSGQEGTEFGGAALSRRGSGY
ncbi:MAG: hypothetical protein H0T10_07800 [Actinobacteria bacterium]|nr:hypothetical protein [Actinomycetota bacterium]